MEGVFGYRRVSDGVPHMEAAEPRTGLLEDAAYPLAATRQYAVFACQGGWNRGTAAFGALLPRPSEPSSLVLWPGACIASARLLSDLLCQIRVWG